MQVNGSFGELSVSLHQAIAGNEIVPEQIQTMIISIAAFLQVILAGYVIGSLIAQYRSRLITQRFKMEAVEAKTSKLCQPSHQF